MEINNKVLVSSIGAAVVAAITGGIIVNVMAIKNIKKDIHILAYSDAELTIANKFQKDDCEELHNEIESLNKRIDSLEKSKK